MSFGEKANNYVECCRGVFSQTSKMECFLNYFCKMLHLKYLTGL